MLQHVTCVLRCTCRLGAWTVHRMQLGRVLPLLVHRSIVRPRLRRHDLAHMPGNAGLCADSWAPKTYADAYIVVILDVEQLIADARQHLRAAISTASTLLADSGARGARVVGVRRVLSRRDSSVVGDCLGDIATPAGAGVLLLDRSKQKPLDRVLRVRRRRSREVQWRRARGCTFFAEAVRRRPGGAGGVRDLPDSFDRGWSSGSRWAEEHFSRSTQQHDGVETIVEPALV
jgi:hypothetical protein